MRNLKLSTKDKADIKAFMVIAKKARPNIDEYRAWVDGITNPLICKQSNIVVTAAGELSVRNLTEVLKPVYKQVRTNVLIAPKHRRRKTTKKYSQKDVKAILDIINNK